MPDILTPVHWDEDPEALHHRQRLAQTLQRLDDGIVGLARGLRLALDQQEDHQIARWGEPRQPEAAADACADLRAQLQALLNLRWDVMRRCAEIVSPACTGRIVVEAEAQLVARSAAGGRTAAGRLPPSAQVA